MTSALINIGKVWLMSSENLKSHFLRFLLTWERKIDFRLSRALVWPLLVHTTHKVEGENKGVYKGRPIIDINHSISDWCASCARRPRRGP